MKGIIFDMDGVILNSEPIHIKVCEEILHDLEISIPEDYFDKYLGIANPVMWKEIKEEFQIKKSVEELVQLQESKTFSTIRKLDIIESPNLIKFLEVLKKENIPCVIASSSPQELINIIVEKLKLESYFKYWISAENYNTSKPDPTIFLEASKKLEISPNDCVVIEDSENGIKAAKRANMKCIAYTRFHIGNPKIEEADVAINDFSQLLNLNIFNNL